MTENYDPTRNADRWTTLWDEREVFAASTLTGPTPADQTFVLDGDSVIVEVDRAKVVQVQNGRGANGTPIVVGPRNLEPAEFWEFQATDGSGADPTAGFVSVSCLDELMQLLPEYGN